jgi:hypothetical protein
MISSPAPECPACHSPVGEGDLRCAACAAPLPARGTGAVQTSARLTVGTWSKITRVCGWCSATTREPREANCDACGGPLPPLPPRIIAEHALGVPDWPEPPPAPRTLPPGYEWRIKLWKNVLVIVGVIFTVPFFWTVVFPAIGLVLWYRGAQRARRWLRALTLGHPVEGTILRVYEDTSEAINDRHPLRIDYAFEAPVGRIEGHVQSWDPISIAWAPGDRVWVVADDADPTSNALWPPVA